MTEHINAASQYGGSSQIESRSRQEVRAQRIETIRLAVQAGTYWVPGELIAAKMIEQYLRASIH